MMKLLSLPCMAIGIALACIATTFGTVSNAAEVNAQPLSETQWLGYAADFDPQWIGVTRHVDWRPPRDSSGVIISMGMISVGMGWPILPPAPLKSVQLVSSNRGVSYSAQASMDSVIAESSSNINKSEQGDYELNIARYAEIVNLQDLLLVDARAVSEQQSTVDDNSITARGRVGTLASLHEELAGQASSSAFSQSLLSANYIVSEAVPFTLNGQLAGAGALDIEFSIVNAASRELIYQVKPIVTADVGRSWKFDLSGVLSPGSYDISISAAATASSNTPLASLGGIGEYELEFFAGRPGHGDLNFDSVADGADLAHWKPAFGNNSSGDMDSNGSIDVLSSYSSALVPEPTGLSLICCAAVLCLGAKNQRRD